MNLTRLRWAVRAVLVLAVGASIAGNVLHAAGGIISQIISAWSPLALLLTIELISRVPVHKRTLALARWVATAAIASIAAWVSYWHMVAVAARYGEAGASPYLLPISVDGLVVVASICLVELGGQIRDEENQAARTPAACTAVTVVESVADSAGKIPARVDTTVPEIPVSRSNESTLRRVGRPSAAARIAEATAKTPAASNAEIAARLSLSEDTVRRHRRASSAGETPASVEVNGQQPVLVGD